MSQNLPQQMQAIEMSAPGGPEVLRLATRPVPAPATGEVLIKVAAAGVNGPDMMQRKGLYPPPAGASGSASTYLPARAKKLKTIMPAASPAIAL